MMTVFRANSMASAKTQPARGMRDFLPADVRKREYVIGVIKEVYERYGFEPLETPAVENLETLMGKYGDEGNQLIFKIMKRGAELEAAQGTFLAARAAYIAASDNEDQKARSMAAPPGESYADLALRY